MRPVFAFGPFTLDAGPRRLRRDGEPVALSDRHLAILLAFVRQPGAVLTKDALIAVAWPDVAVSDNSLEQAISSLRRVVGAAAIETLARRGYRFTLPVRSAPPRADDAALERLLGPHRAFLEGRAALERLDRDAVARAREVFAAIVATTPGHPGAHIGLANALAMAYETTRVEAAPDAAALSGAVEHAREACRLEAQNGEAWATLAFVLSRAGGHADALAAARQAIALEPDNWRHHVRLGYAAWGEERLRAARRALQLLPGLALAHWLAATVYVARQDLADAERELEAGTAAQDRQRAGGRFGAVGLHLLLGLVRLARGDEGGAVAELQREMQARSLSHLYGREAVANACCALAAIHARGGRQEETAAALRQALEIVPGYPPALALEGGRRRMPDEVRAALQQAPPGPAEWMLPIDPAANVGADPVAWADVLDLLRIRAA
jgi:DNA-binding winged helix-turn-helix (wHTH) protein/Flp pilus assembly protein TadD